MTREEIRATVLRLLGEVAPEADLAGIRPEASLRDQLDVDSMDVLNLMIRLHDALGVEIPEADYGKLGTLDGAVRYLAAALGAGTDAAAPAPGHRFEARLRWARGRTGVTAGNHVVEFAGRASIEVSGAPQYGGDASKLNPEELFVASLASCQLLTYLALAGRARIELQSYEDRPVATLAAADRKVRITEVILRPRIVLAPGGDVAKARELVDAAHGRCFIASSVSCTVRVEADVLAAA